jgi:RNA-directed DNA polymerase
MERQVSAWLKCGAVEGFAKSRAKLKAEEIVPTESGTPQGGVISPLLANIALHGLETHIRETVGRRPGPSNRANRGYRAKAKSLGFVRYADDFVILHDSREILDECITETRKWLAGMGLEISEEKSAVRDVREGFQFLGFQVIMIKRKYGNLRYKTLIRPSTPNKKKLLHKVKVVIARNKAISSYDLIEKLRPIILGWANYFRYSECASDFLKVQHAIFLKLRAWVFRRSVRVGRRATKQKYFPRGEHFFEGRKRRADWVLVGRKKVKGGVKTNFLPYLTWVQSKKHVKVKGNESPFTP